MLLLAVATGRVTAVLLLAPGREAAPFRAAAVMVVGTQCKHDPRSR